MDGPCVHVLLTLQSAGDFLPRQVRGGGHNGPPRSKSCKNGDGMMKLSSIIDYPKNSQIILSISLWRHYFADISIFCVWRHHILPKI